MKKFSGGVIWDFEGFNGGEAISWIGFLRFVLMMDEEDDEGYATYCGGGYYFNLGVVSDMHKLGFWFENVCDCCAN